ncbi:hypothetical protein KGF56_003520 [Candida oxycetoniae]|uniref:Uncharacterized protein n=1 Tax=Candida oxycetoniae TaxID=497107 RepID=A0AAI9SVI8_9ASCO|nr:uncharacterized protein KGF56_003520 [Candida oxycetoniae]KAI3403702.2 hypothetical protein KGF56_003520 [Candida oxycetoniae]
MEAGTSLAVQRGRLRRQLLEGEQNIDTLSESLLEQQYQQQQRQQQSKHPRFVPAYLQQQQQQQQQHPYNGPRTNSINSISTANYDIMTPLPGSHSGTPFTSNSNSSFSNITSNSRKSSLTTQSINKFFRRNHHKGDFNEDAGVDIGDLADATNMSFDDITHLRNTKSYNSTAPIIPTYGTMGSNTSKINNVQYRKQMNQQKKMALLTGARANSIAGGANPMLPSQQLAQQQLPPQQQQMGVTDPRSMSLGGNYSRARSLNSQLPGAMPPMRNQFYPQQNQPMSNYPFSGQYNQNQAQAPNQQFAFSQIQQQQQQGPRAMSLKAEHYMMQKQQYPPSNYNNNNNNNNGQMQYAQGAPRSNTFMGGGMPNYDPKIQNGPNYSSRTKSLGGMTSMGMAGPYQEPKYQGLINRNQNLAVNNSGPPYNRQQQYQQQGPLNNQQFSYSQQPNSQQPFAPSSFQNQYNQDSSTFGRPSQLEQVSSDSLNDVPEEEEYNQNQVAHQKTSPSEPDEGDVIYNFDEQENMGSNQLSRKSTLRKNNSTRVRKLNIFNDEANSRVAVGRKKPPSSSVQEEQDFSVHSDQLEKTPENIPLTNVSQEKHVPCDLDTDESYDTVESMAADKSSKAHAGYNSNTSSQKPGAIFASNSDSLAGQLSQDDETIGENENENENESVNTSGRGSVLKPPFPRKISESSSIRNLVANTAFSNFRSSSNDSDLKLSSPSLPLVRTNSSPTSIYEEPGRRVKSSETDESQYSQPEQQTTFDNKEDDGNNNDNKNNNNNNNNDDDYDKKNGGLVSPSMPMTTPTTPNISHNRFVGSASEEPMHATYSMSHAITEPIQDTFKEESHQFTPVSRIGAHSRHATNSSISTGGSNYDYHHGEGEGEGGKKILSNSISSHSSRKEKRSSFAHTGKKLLKKLSKSKKSSPSVGDDYLEKNDTKGVSTSRTSSINKRISSPATLASSGKLPTSIKEPLSFSKSEMHVMNCNSDLLAELESITRELASSIKREMALEAKLKSNKQQSPPIGTGAIPSSSRSSIAEENLHTSLLEKSNIICGLQEKLNKEKRLRFISEEHALLYEHGQSPSPLKLNYEKTEIYNQLVAKNEMVTQLTNRVRELEEELEKEKMIEYSQMQSMDHDLMNRISSLEKENTEVSEENALLQEEIRTLQTQRDDFREVISKLSVQSSQDIKQLSEKIKTLELKNSNLKNINDMLTNREGNINTNNNNGGVSENQNYGNYDSSMSGNGSYSSASKNFYGMKNRIGLPSSGGKLNGFTIISSDRKFHNNE